MVDRKARDKVADALEKYLNDEITAFEFDNMLWEDESVDVDETLKDIRRVLWRYYDDLTDHKVVASEEDLDFFHRLLLMLRSNAEYAVTKGRYWTVRNGIAICCLLLIAGRAAWLGFEYPAGLSIMVGLVSMALTFSRRWSEPVQSSREKAMVPFDSVCELMAVRKSVPSFRKKRYPVHLQSRRHPTPFIDRLMYYLMCAISLPIYVSLWLLLSPVVLFLQAIPENESEHRLVFPN